MNLRTTTIYVSVLGLTASALAAGNQKLSLTIYNTDLALVEDVRTQIGRASCRERV